MGTRGWRALCLVSCAPESTRPRPVCQDDGDGTGLTEAAGGLTRGFKITEPQVLSEQAARHRCIPKRPLPGASRLPRKRQHQRGKTRGYTTCLRRLTR